VLFVPLGAALAWAGLGWRRTWLIGAAFSAVIEYAQLFVPGRSTSVADVCSNSLGALVGWGAIVVLARAAARAERPPLRSTLAASALFAGIVAFTGYILKPSFVDAPYFAMWTPSLAHLEWYRGHVVRASIADMPLPSAQLASTARFRQLFANGAELDVRAIVGPPVQGIAPIFTIYDDVGREILLVGPDRANDLVLRLRTRAASCLLDQPDLPALGALNGTRERDTLSIRVRSTGGAYDVRVNEDRRRLGFTAGQGWALLKYPESFPQILRSLLDFAWLAGVALPLGFWGASRRGLATAAVTIGIALGVLGPAAGLLATPPAQWVGAISGVLLGAATREFALRRRRR